MSDAGTLVIRRLIRASREKLFAMWTDEAAENSERAALWRGPFRAATRG